MKHKTLTYIDSCLLEGQSGEHPEPAKITAIGFVVKETDDYIVLARELVDDEFRGQLCIPKIAITK